MYTLNDRLDGRQRTVQGMLRASGYRTAIVGKWHLGHGGIYDPTGFDYWNVLPGQGAYHNPEMIEVDGRHQHEGYATDIITDLGLEWLDSLGGDAPFLLMMHHKAPHRPWQPGAKHAGMYEDITIPTPDTFDDDYAGRAHAAALATMRIDRDLTPGDLKQEPPAGLTGEELKLWKYERFIKDYLRCVASVDDNVGRVLDYLDRRGLAENTVVIYTSDQGFFLGDHDWFDKRFMYEESLRMPFLVRYPREVRPGTVTDLMSLNVDFAPTYLDYAGLATPTDVQGRSLRGVFRGERPADWRTSMYYRYWMRDHATHNVAPQYGVITYRHKLIYYYDEEWGPKEWELFDLEVDPRELRNVYAELAYATTVAEMKSKLRRLRQELGDTADDWEQEVPRARLPRSVSWRCW